MFFCIPSFSSVFFQALAKGRKRSKSKEEDTGFSLGYFISPVSSFMFLNEK